MVAPPFLPECYQTVPSAIDHSGARFGERLEVLASPCTLRPVVALARTWKLFAKGSHVWVNAGHHLERVRTHDHAHANKNTDIVYENAASAKCTFA